MAYNDDLKKNAGKSGAQDNAATRTPLLASACEIQVNWPSLCPEPVRVAEKLPRWFSGAARAASPCSEELKAKTASK